MEEKKKNTLYILAAIGVTIIGVTTGLWLVWGFVITLMVIESLVSSLKSWTKERDKHYLEILQKNQLGSANNTDLLLSIQTSLASIEERLKALEK
ncbi:hypothetical protein RJ40_02155 [Methanofollis aquaemaris]|uniref:Uncharacterized protein n=1 Tax=Methanofollis aquaemaris TaxID=126734 RepID=A0A8A3S2J1_9EURY|nr:hypothetical protein [Methanofollis aquaemaris]QSZ66385.1 hypothetical protein RJ40_02155 [Methanofollis aquaemaris]